MEKKQRKSFCFRQSTLSKMIFLVAVSILLSYGCQSKRYTITSIEGKYIPVTQTHKPDQRTVEFINKYKFQLESQMNEVVGYAEEDMPTGKPESLLTNFTSDVMMTIDPVYTGGTIPDLSFMNVSGHRAPIAKGNITVGDLFNTYSFENQLAVVRLSGKYLKEVLESYARMGGGGISSTVKMHIKDGKADSATVKGNPINDEQIYTIITLDYLAEGNSRMDALTKAVSTELPGITLRDFMIDYVRQQTAKGEAIKSVLDQRITIEPTNDEK